MNIELLKLLDGAEDKYPHSLEEKFPHVITKLIELWGLPAINQYFTDLLLHTRAVPRQGFPPNVVKEIFELNLISEKQTKEIKTN